MTVCVGVKVYDCLVFAADSAVTVSQSAGTNVWEHGSKVFHLHKQLPIAAMTAGLGNFGPASVSQLAKDVRIMLMEKLDESEYTINEVADKVIDFYYDAYSRIDPPPPEDIAFQLWIGGYSANDDRGEMWVCGIYKGKKIDPQIQISPDYHSRVIWGGQLSALNRLLFGIDITAFRRALNELEIEEKAVNFLEGKIRQYAETPLVHPAMPVQDAINLAEFLVYVAKRYSHFLPGESIVGGDTDIATVTKHERFKWIRRKHYYPSHLNIGGKDHAHNTQ